MLSVLEQEAKWKRQQVAKERNRIVINQKMIDQVKEGKQKTLFN